MSTPFVDLDKRQLDTQSAAQQKRARFKLINSALASNALAADEGIAPLTADERNLELAHVLALGTDAANFVIVDLVANCAPVRAFVDAVIGVTGGDPDFVFVTDQELADRMGVTTKTVQKARKRFMETKNYSALIEIKRNYRTPEGESFPHRYRCKVTALAVEAMENAQLSPGWTGGIEHRMKAMKDAAETVTQGASLGALTPPDKRRKATDREVVNSSLKMAQTMLAKARKRRPMVKNPDFDEVWEQLEATRRELMAVYAAYDLTPSYSMQNTEEEAGKETEVFPPDDPSQASRMEAESELTATLQLAPVAPENVSHGRQTDAENASGWNLCSTLNDSTDSTTYESGENSPPEETPPADAPASLYEQDLLATYERFVSGGMSRPDARKAALDEVGHSPEEWRRKRAEVFDRVFSGLKGGGRDGR